MSNRELMDKTMRADTKFIERIRSTIPNRMRNFPEENVKTLSDRELTRMMTNTVGFEESLKELETLPRRNK